MEAEIAAVWRQVSGETLPSGAIGVTGSESVLPGPFRVAAAAAASIGVATHAAAELLRFRGIEAPPVEVDLRHAAAAFHSERHLRVDGQVPGEPWAPLTGDYLATDGWVRLHCNYPRHVSAVCWGLGTAATREAVTEAVAKRRAREVQEAVVAAGGAAALMRTREDWLSHPQGEAVAGQPLVDLRQTGDAPPKRLFESHRPLGGVRVLELTHVIAGPVAGRVLAAHGADVLHLGAAHLPRLDPLWMDTGLGKRSAFTDLTQDAGRARLRKLLTKADVFVQSFRPGALARWGFSPEELADEFPGLITLDLSAYGTHGPWRTRRGFDSLVQMASGIAAHAGLDQPRPLPAQALDHATGWLAAATVMTALRRAAADGGGWRGQVALAHTAEWLESLGRREDTTTGYEAGDLLAKLPSPYGELTYVPVPGAAPQWTEGTRLPGTDRPSW
ncbi:CoA transferase [Amycolatopsis magusensis]|uniref:CoA transferase n=1 Tax=Amycolatopsis magusensis TaxID=882444 RepID=UPI001AE9AFE0|nr:CoA transferase [Amycolatopsis magusensis]